MLTYEEFTEELVHSIPDYLPSGLKERGLEVQQIVSTNDHKRDVLTPAGAEGSGSSKPVMYLDEIYAQYQSMNPGMEVICRMVAETMEQAMTKSPDYNTVQDQIKAENAFPALINLENNREYLKDVPHLVLGDLAVVYKIPVVEEKMGRGTVTINNALLEKMEISQEELFTTAYENMEKRNALQVERMEDTLFLNPEPVDGKTTFTFDELDSLPDDFHLLVVSNTERYWGDGLLLMKENIEKLSERIESSLIIIPSSVHEVIVIPDTGGTIMETCLEMVKDVNETTVDPKERLSNSIYRYDRDRMELELHAQDGTVRDMKLERPDQDREAAKKKSEHER